MWSSLKALDRRWLFTLTFVVISLPLLLGIKLPQRIRPMVRNVFKAIDELPDGSDVLIAVDYAPSSEGELQPMADAFTRHCAEKNHKLYFLTIWPDGVGMIQRATNILNKEYPEYVYGEDYVNLGYRPGQEVVITTIVNDLPALYGFDQFGTSVENIPMMKDVNNIQGFPLIINISAGDPGLKHWIQYAATPFESIEIIGGTTGVQAAAMFPYVPKQMVGMLPGIKSAAEYELVLYEHYPELASRPNTDTGQKYMTAQEAAHFMLILIIIFGNILMLTKR